MTSALYLIAIALTIISWLIPFVMLFIVPANRKPSSATAWLLLIFALPWLGLIVFLLIGSPKLSARRRALQREINSYITQFIAEARADPRARMLLAPPVAQRYQPFVNLSSALGALPALADNGVEILTDYDDILARIAADIDGARRFVHVQFYILIADEATEACFQAMERAVARGIAVRVLYDPVGSRKYPPYRATLRRMQAAGISAYPMLPLYRLDDVNRPDLRNHRKIVVIDGEVAYTGSFNLIDRRYHRRDAIQYDELMARVCGPAADALDAVFRADWFSETGERLSQSDDPALAITFTPGGTSLCQVLPSGSGFERENNLRLFVDLIHASRHKLVICNPYFVPDEALMMAVVSSALRGVDVTIYNSEAQDQFLVAYAQRSYYEELLRAGVKIRLYRAPTLLHTKTISIDDDIAVIGSSNMDMRSFELNLEVTLLCYDPNVVADLRQAEASYHARSRSIELDSWLQRPLHNRLFENLTRLMSALL
ncbi:MAG: cardiolipin synthase [Chloroflexi bacterium]|nr:cardiolipin synthase [Chloroflexota bacterium]